MHFYYIAEVLWGGGGGGGVGCRCGHITQTANNRNGNGSKRQDVVPVAMETLDIGKLT